MDRTDQLLNVPPAISIIIAVHNDWTMLNSCLSSIAQQKELPFECVVVDDGSAEQAPESVQRWGQHFPLTIVRNKHEGVSTARNTGIRSSRAPLLLFVDADCRLLTGCLTELASAVAASPKEDFFQLRLVGDCSTETGRAEELRLATLQEHMLQPDGCIRYLNTAAFAARRIAVDATGGLFDPHALRGEDTLLLVDLIQRDHLPQFVPKAIVQHSVPSSFLACLRKDIRSGYLQSGTYAFIAKSGVKIRVGTGGRLKMLASSWQTARNESIGRTAWFRLLARQLAERTVSLGSQLLKLYPKMPKDYTPSRKADEAP